MNIHCVNWFRPTFHLSPQQKKQFNWTIKCLPMQQSTGHWLNCIIDYNNVSNR